MHLLIYIFSYQHTYIKIANKVLSLKSKTSESDLSGYPKG